MMELLLVQEQARHEPEVEERARLEAIQQQQIREVLLSLHNYESI
jgi:hypothetical protein